MSSETDGRVPRLQHLCTAVLSQLLQQTTTRLPLHRPLPASVCLDIIAHRHEEAKADKYLPHHEFTLAVDIDDAFMRHLCRWNRHTPSQMAACHQNFYSVHHFREQDMSLFTVLTQPAPLNTVLFSNVRTKSPSRSQVHPGLSGDESPSPSQPSNWSSTSSSSEALTTSAPPQNTSAVGSILSRSDSLGTAHRIRLRRQPYHSPCHRCSSELCSGDCTNETFAGDLHSGDVQRRLSSPHAYQSDVDVITGANVHYSCYGDVTTRVVTRGTEQMVRGKRAHESPTDVAKQVKAVSGRDLGRRAVSHDEAEGRSPSVQRQRQRRQRLLDNTRRGGTFRDELDVHRHRRVADDSMGEDDADDDGDADAGDADDGDADDDEDGAAVYDNEYDGYECASRDAHLMGRGDSVDAALLQARRDHAQLPVKMSKTVISDSPPCRPRPDLRQPSPISMLMDTSADTQQPPQESAEELSSNAMDESKQECDNHDDEHSCIHQTRSPNTNSVCITYHGHDLVFTELRALEEVHLHRCMQLKRQGLCFLVDHPLAAFSFTHARLSSTFFTQAARCWAQSLVYLNIAGCGGVRNHQVYDALSHLQCLQHLNVADTKIRSLPPLPRLQVLHAESTRLTSQEVITLSQHSRYLRELYLQVTEIDVDIGSALCIMPNLEALGLAGCANFGIPQNTQALDIARSYRVGKFFTQTLLEISTNKLRWLDVSFTAVPARFYKKVMERFPSLQYLGLAGTLAQDALPRQLPSTVTIGCLNRRCTEAAVAFNNLPLSFPAEDLKSVLRTVYGTIPRSMSDEEHMTGNEDLVKRLVDLSWYRMDERDLMLVTTAILYYVIVPTEQASSLRKLRREALCLCKRLLAVHCDFEQLVKNLCLTLWHFDPWTESVEFAVELGQNLLKVANMYTDNTIRTCALGIVCRDLASLPPAIKKQLVDEAHVFQDIFGFITSALETDMQDADLVRHVECCWTLLWNITDEAPSNCTNAVALPICLDTVKQTLTSSWSTPAMKRNIMGFLANVSEVGPLLSQFFTTGLVEIVANTIAQTTEMEVNYNGTGILCNLAVIPELWKASTFSLEAALAVVRNQVKSWELNTESKINYRSLRPVIVLLERHHPWVVNYWACWALQNLCLTAPQQYCPMAIKEGALNVLEPLTRHPEQDVRNLASPCLKNILTWHANQARAEMARPS
eukprot:m.25219 g.25219  ORF g.25219 m.25219 type:complete len:1187 (+) comp9810_c1_seq1:62-3622(+)